MKRYRSDAQLNAEALQRRGSSYTDAAQASVTVAWNYHNREPKDLRECVRMVRQAYSDEVPTRLHEGYDSIGEGGTPKMDVRAEGYLFGHDEAGYDRDRPVLDYYRTPFRAALHRLGKSPRGKIVSHVAIGSMGPMEAAIREGVPAWCAKVVAEDTLRGFLRSVSDVKVNLAKVTQDAA